MYPVNYQVSSNDDIVELLKYDILIELTKKYENIFKTTEIDSFIDYTNLVYLFWNNNKVEIIKNLISFIPKIWRPLNESIWLIKKFSEFHNKINGWELKVSEDYLDNIKNKDLGESDMISNLIHEKLDEKKESKINLLILDDLDRIDPQHIFRIMNVFWAHFHNEHRSEGNKFWFDKVILVWDYTNIENIFKHKYWSETDFRWYIDKFYSSEIYFFNNKKIIWESINRIISKIKYWEVDYQWALWEQGYTRFIIQNILEDSSTLDSKYKLNLRELLKPIKFELSPLNRKRLDLWETSLNYFDTGIRVLIIIFGWNKNNLINVLKNIKISRQLKKDSNLKRDKFIYKIINDMIHKLYNTHEVQQNFTWLEFIEESNWLLYLGSSNDSIDITNTYYDVLIEYTRKLDY